MDKQSLFFTALVSVVSTALMLMALQFLAKKLKIKPENEQKTNISYSIWAASIMIVFFMFLKIALELIENSIELIIHSKTIDNTFLAVMEKIAIFTGFTFLFTFLAYYITYNISKLLMGNRVDSIEIEKDNIGYFIFNGLLLILLVFSLTIIFQHFLGWFMPVVETPFYH
jgi:hypothetical protein